MKVAHRDDKLRGILQDLHDLRSDPSLQIYYDAPAEPLQEILGAGGIQDAFSRGYLQADYIGEDTIKANIRAILSEGVYEGLGVGRAQPSGLMERMSAERQVTEPGTVGLVNGMNAWKEKV